MVWREGVRAPKVARFTQVSAASGPRSVTSGFGSPGVGLRSFAGARVRPRPRVPVPVLRTSREVLQDVQSGRLGGSSGVRGCGRSAQSGPTPGPFPGSSGWRAPRPPAARDPLHTQAFALLFPSLGAWLPSSPSLSLEISTPLGVGLNVSLYGRCPASSLDWILKSLPHPPLGLARVFSAHHGAASLQTLASRGPDHPSPVHSTRHGMAVSPCFALTLSSYLFELRFQSSSGHLRPGAEPAASRPGWCWHLSLRCAPSDATGTGQSFGMSAAQSLGSGRS